MNIIPPQLAEGNENKIFKLLYLYYQIFRNHSHSRSIIQRFSGYFGSKIISPGALHMAGHLVIVLCTPLV